jgi:Tfp pilus assembly protein PilO
MTPGRFEQLLNDLRPEAALAAMLALGALVLLGGHLYLLGPSFAKFRELESKGPQTTLESLTGALADGRLAVTALEEELEQLRKRLYGGPADLPIEKTESYIIDRLDRISGRHGIELVSVKPGEAKEVLMFDEFLYEVEVKGDFFALVAWLREVEEDLRPMVLNQFNLKPEAKREAVAMKLRLASYRPRGGVS